MSSFVDNPATWLTLALERAARDEAARIVAEEAEVAQKRVAERMAQMVDRLALSALAHYQVEARGMELIIRVDRRELTPPPT